MTFVTIKTSHRKLTPEIEASASGNLSSSQGQQTLATDSAASDPQSLDPQAAEADSLSIQDLEEQVSSDLLSAEWASAELATAAGGLPAARPLRRSPARQSPEDPFEQGYEAAAQELLSNLVWMAEDFLSARPRTTPVDRKLLYGFVAMLEKRLCHMQSEAGVVEGGLGI